MHARVNVFIKAFRDDCMSRFANKKNNDGLQLRVMLKAKGKSGKEMKKLSISKDNLGESVEMFSILVEITAFRHFPASKLSSTISEHIILKRDPSNQFDSNAISVLNTDMTQVGYVAKADCCKLAVLFDFISKAETIHSTISKTRGICSLVISTGECNRAEFTNFLTSPQGLPFYDISYAVDHGYTNAISKNEIQKVQTVPKKKANKKKN